MSESVPLDLMQQPGMAAAVQSAQNETPQEPNWEEEHYWAQQAENRVALQEGRPPREITREEVEANLRGTPVAQVAPSSPPPAPPAPQPQYDQPVQPQPVTGPPAAVPTSETGANAGSLIDRMQQRREFLDRQHTIKLALPGYEGVLKVELKTVDWATLRKIAIRHENIDDQVTQELYQGADEVMTATVQFFEVNPDGSENPLPGETYTTLARRVGRADASTTPRQAILALLRDMDLMLLCNAWRQWNALIRDEVMEALKQDFGTTL